MPQRSPRRALVRTMTVALSALALLASVSALAQTRADPEAATGLAAKPAVRAETHMIVAANPHAARAGLVMLRKGGSAADAAVAAMAVLNVVEPQSSGIGGGAFALVEAGAGPISYDARETAPGAAGPALFLDADAAPLPWPVARISGRSTGVPGLVALMARLHAEHGRLPWAVLFEPAIALARDGFEVSPRLAGLVATYADWLADKPVAALLIPEGQPIAAGARLTMPRLGETFARIASEGPDAFYQGAIPEAIVAATAAEPMPGRLSVDDIAAYRVIERPAVCVPFRAYRVCGMGPPSSGATTVGQILALMARVPVAAAVEEAALWHRFAEASRLAYADRAQYLGDPDQVAVPVAGLLDAAYLDARAALIDPEVAMASPAKPGTPPGAPAELAPAPASDSPGTTHLSVIDGEGLAISLTASIESAFGSGRMAAGFLLNNQLTDFAFAPTDAAGRARANAPDAGKRPRSSMAPTLVYEGARLVALAGSPGGSRIPEYVAAALLGMLDHGLDPAEAAALFHLSQRNRAATVLEPQAPDALAEALLALGHTIERAEMTSGLHLIQIGDALVGGADPRREGIALGD